MKSRIVFALTVLAVVGSLARSQQPTHPLDGLREAHPRVIATSEDVKRIRTLLEHDPVAQEWHQRTRDLGERLLESPPATYDIADGVRLLAVSRRAVGLVQTLGLLHLVEPDDRYRDRIWKEVDAAARFPDWNPRHFLDVGEMALALALAYDWLHDDWTPAEREQIREALLRHALRPGLDAHENGAWWARGTNNWNQVCNGGLACAALAIADEEPEIAGEIVRRTVDALPRVMKLYEPDGGYTEGPGYWGYGTRYNTYMLAALESALGHDFGLGATPGFEDSSRFVQHCVGPSGTALSFGDGTETRMPNVAHLYFARRFRDASALRYAIEHPADEAIGLLWYEPAVRRSDPDPLPLDAHYPVNAGIVMMRSDWDDPDASFVSLKGGRNGVSHGQLDLGTFTYEVSGHRWITDLGRDDYNLPGYFGDRRYTYYRHRAEGHNTLVVDPGEGPDQPLDARAPTTLRSSPGGATATVDLTQATGLDHAERTLVYDRGTHRLTVIDELDAGQYTADIRWFAHARASIALDDTARVATLEHAGKRVRVVLESPDAARFQIVAPEPLPTSPNPPGQNPNNGSRLLNAAPGASMTKKGVLPAYGNPDPSRAIRKLAIQMELTGATTIRCRVEPVETGP